eukprot:3938127-Pyramimonas_sp.AAC.1
MPRLPCSAAYLPGRPGSTLPGSPPRGRRGPRWLPTWPRRPPEACPARRRPTGAQAGCART